MSSPESSAYHQARLDSAFEEPSIREMALILGFDNDNIPLESGTWERMCENVAAIAGHYQLTPDETQGLLERHDETLAAGPNNWFAIIAQMQEAEVQES